MRLTSLFSNQISLIGCILFLLLCLVGCPTSDDPDAETCFRASDCSNTMALCVDGVCRTECGDTRDCPQGNSCVSGMCEPDPCNSDFECNADQECIQGQCVTVSSAFCNGDNDCLLGQECDRDTRRCTDVDSGGCNLNSDCLADQTCVGGVCEDDRASCALNSDCDEDELCIEGRCAPECVEDRDCPNDEVCDRGRCEMPASTSNGTTSTSNGTTSTSNGTTSTSNGTTMPMSCTENPNVCEASEECCEGACVVRGQCGDEPNYWDACSGADQCSTGLCLGGASGNCTQRCGLRADCPQNPISSLCIQSYNIITQQNGGNQLVGLCYADDTGEVCNPQQQNSCFDGLCIGRQFNTQGQCSVRCLSAADCRPGYACGPKEFNVNGSAQLVNVCVPIGESCTGGGNNAAELCFSSFCVVDDETNQGVCSTLCATAAECPTGWQCVDAGQANVCAR